MMSHFGCTNIIFADYIVYEFQYTYTGDNNNYKLISQGAFNHIELVCLDIIGAYIVVVVKSIMSITFYIIHFI